MNILQIYISCWVNWLLMVAHHPHSHHPFERSNPPRRSLPGTAVSTPCFADHLLLYRAGPMRDLWKLARTAALPVGRNIHHRLLDPIFLSCHCLRITRRRLCCPLPSRRFLFLVHVTWRSGVDAIRATLCMLTRNPLTVSDRI